MYSYFFPDASDRRGAKPVTFHSDVELEDRELEQRLLDYNATRVEINPNSAGAPRLTGHDELVASHAARRAAR